jgi:hypothetical protein
MEPLSILQVHAEVAMALGGFASVTAALGRPLGAVRRQRFLALLFLAFVQVLASLIPSWVSQVSESPVFVWRFSTALYLVLAMIVIATTVVLPLRRIGVRANPVISPMVTHLVNVVAGVSVVVLPLNFFATSIGPGFPIYYGSLLLAFAVGFVLFADAVLKADDVA